MNVCQLDSLGEVNFIVVLRTMSNRGPGAEGERGEGEKNRGEEEEERGEEEEERGEEEEETGEEEGGRGEDERLNSPEDFDVDEPEKDEAKTSKVYTAADTLLTTEEEESSMGPHALVIDYPFDCYCDNK